ncbi:ribonuclease H-like domain-containing protein [Tanacetum coccineum]
MDLKWQLALLSMRTRRFFQKTSRKITINGSDTTGYDKSKVECFNCRKIGHFARKCRGPRNQDSRNKNQDSFRRTVNVEETSSKSMVVIDGASFDWSYMADEENLYPESMDSCLGSIQYNTSYNSSKRLWSMKMEQYLTHIDYALWEVIVNGDAPAAFASASAGAKGPTPPKTVEQKLVRKNELKAKSTLLLAIPDEHLLKFHGIRMHDLLWEAIKTRFRGNKESNKMQKTILKQQYENFVASRSEGLDKTYDRFQKLISQLEIHGEYEMWEMRIKQYFQVQDYALWEVIENGNLCVSVPQTTQENRTTVTKNSVPVTAEEKICKKNDVKARSLLVTPPKFVSQRNSVSWGVTS